MSVLAKTVEIALTEEAWTDRAECSVEIFHDSRYLFQLKLWSKAERSAQGHFRETMRNVSFTSRSFEAAKKEVWNQLKERQEMGFDNMRPGDIVNCCREHFLYDEPMVCLESRLEDGCRFLGALKYHRIKENLGFVWEQFVRTCS